MRFDFSLMIMIGYYNQFITRVASSVFGGRDNLSNVTKSWFTTEPDAFGASRGLIAKSGGLCRTLVFLTTTSLQQEMD